MAPGEIPLRFAVSGNYHQTSTATQPKVLLRHPAELDCPKLLDEDVVSIVCHRYDKRWFEQYLVRWEWASLSDQQKPHSWHNLLELSDCLPKVQKYLDSLSSESNKLQHVKRKRNNSMESPNENGIYSEDVINGVLSKNGGVIKIKPFSSKFERSLPTELMMRKAAETDTRQALFAIRTAFDQKLSDVQVKLEIINQLDGSRPPLDFEFIDRSVIGSKEVRAAEPATVVGCGNIRRKIGPSGAALVCSPNMGQQVGCEYSRVCECLEFAAVDETRLKTKEDMELFANGDTETLPKRFPYQTRTGFLTEYYLDRRNCIYECNPRCKCGPGCRTRVVQHGRTVPLQIFKTENRGWGLRCTKDLEKGQFIDTYRGEIITSAEADRREQASDLSSGLKASYLYSLDKHVGQDLSEDECYVVDGEFKGGPTRFLNHSCDPNVRQYTVSYNKYDNKIYELAFFACRRIPAMEELTFDYMDREDDEDNDNDDHDNANGVTANGYNYNDNNDSDNDDGDSDIILLKEAPAVFKVGSWRNENSGSANKMKCFCGSAKCRKTLWM